MNAQTELDPIIRIADKKSYGCQVGVAHAVSTEIWLPVQGWPYIVSNYGNVRRTVKRKGTRAGVILKPTRGGGPSRPYPVVTLHDCGKNRTVAVHKLVADAFLGPCPEGLEINHKDQDSSNSHADNLEYLTSSQNKLQAVANGYCGSRRYNARFTEADIVKIREEAKHARIKDIAEAYGVSSSLIVKIIKRQNWRHVP